MTKKIVKSNINYMGYLKKAGALVGIGLVGGLAGMGGGVLMDKPVANNTVDVDALSTQITDKMTDNLDDIKSSVQSNTDKLMEDDIWEAEAEVIALEELEEDDYEELFEWMNDGNFDINDEDDIKYVRVENTNFRKMDVSDKDGIVYQKLKVRYENDDGVNDNAYITARTEIKDGEIEEQSFEETTNHWYFH